MPQTNTDFFMGPFFVASLLLLFVRTEGRAFDPCNCDDLEEPDVKTSDGFRTDRPDSNVLSEKSKSPSPRLESGAQSRQTQNSVGIARADYERSKESGNINDIRINSSVRRSEREVPKGNSGSANKTDRPSLEAANLESSAPLASPTGNNGVVGAKTDKPESQTNEGPSARNTVNNQPASNENKPNTRRDSPDNLPTDDSTFATAASARADSSDTDNPDLSTATENVESTTTEAQCEQHYSWDDNFKRCFYDPYNVPQAKYDVNGNIDVNAGSRQQTTESNPTTTVVDDCPEHQKWDEALKNCYFHPDLKPPAETDEYGDVFANAG